MIEKEELKVPAGFTSAQGAEASLQQGAEDSEDAGDNVEKTVSRYWAVYRFRQEINRYLFGGHGSSGKGLP